MSQATAPDARLSLTAHAASKGRDIRARYGPEMGWAELQRLLQDRACVRYPVDIVFDASPLRPGELAHPVAKGLRPEDGFTLCVHPRFATQLPRAVYAVLYQLVVVNYGGFASADDAEAFGAAALGISKDAYYQALCGMADELTAAARTSRS